MAFSLLTASVKPAHAQYRFASEEIALVFCAYVRDNDTTRLQNKMRELRIRMRDVYTSIRCNGASLVQFALKTNAQDIGSFIVRSVNMNSLNELGDYEWAQTNGYSDTVIGKALSERFARSARN